MLVTVDSSDFTDTYGEDNRIFRTRPPPDCAIQSSIYYAQTHRTNSIRELKSTNTSESDPPYLPKSTISSQVRRTYST